MKRLLLYFLAIYGVFLVARRLTREPRYPMRVPTCEEYKRADNPSMSGWTQTEPQRYAAWINSVESRVVK